MYSLLYVDDESGLLEIGKLFLENTGDFSVKTVDSASAALELIQCEHFDAIISDYQMPVMDGITFLKEVRLKYGHIPFILFTGRGREEVVIQAINNGADFYLQKGGDLESLFTELAHKVISAASRKKAEDEVFRINETLIRQTKSLSVLNRIISTANNATTRKQLFEEILNETLTLLDYEAGGIYLIDKTREIAELVFFNNISQDFITKFGTVATNIPPFDTFFSNGVPLFTEHYENVSPVQFALTGYCSFASVPLYSKNKIIGALNVASKNRHVISEDEKLTLVTIGRELGSIIDRFTAEEESKNAIKALAESEDRLQSALNASQMGIWDFDLEQNTVWRSLRHDQIFGYESILPKWTFEMFLDHILAPDRDFVAREFKKMESRRDDWHFECRIKRARGEVRWISVTKRVVFDSRDKPKRVLGLVKDITDSKNTLEALALEKTLIDAIFNSVPGMIYLYDAEGRLVRWNKKHELMTGYSADELSHMQLLDWYKGDSISEKAVIEGVKTTLLEGYGEAFANLQKKDGTTLPMYFTASPLRINEKQYFTGIGIDLTSRKRIEEDLKESESYLSALINSITESAMLLTKDGTILAANDTVARRLGFQCSKDLIGKNSFDFLPVDVAVRRKDAIFNVITSKKPIKFEDMRLGRYILNSIYPVIDTDGGASRVAVFGIDITDHKQAEETLRVSEERLKFKLETILSPDYDIREIEFVNIVDTGKIQSMMDEFYSLTSIGIAILDLKGNILVATGWQDICTKFHRVNEHSCENCIESDLYLTKNVKPGEYLIYKCKNNMWDMVTPIIFGQKHVGNLFLGQFFFDDEVLDYDMFTLQAEKFGFNKEEYLAALKRVPRWSRDKVKTIMDFYTKFASMVSNLSYNNLKLAKALLDYESVVDALALSEEKFREYIEYSPEGIFVTDAGGRYIEVNEAACHLTGYTREELLTLDITRLVPKGAVLKAKERFKGLMTNRQIFEESVLLKKDGTEIPVALNAVSLPNGKFLAFCTNIIEQKKASEALQRSNRQLKILSEITRHDINNKISVILGNLKFAAKKSQNSSIEENMEKIESATRAIQSQIAFTRVYQDLGTHEPQWQDLDNVFPGLPVPETVTLNVDVTGILVYADPMLERVFFNLLDNSIKHGGDVTQIRISSCQSGDALKIIWEDDGVGIPTEEKIKIFERGFGNNSGLGMFLVQEILLLTGITISETGITGKGARFEISVPKEAWQKIQVKR